MYLVTSCTNHEMSGMSGSLVPFLPMDTTMFGNDPGMNKQYARILILALSSFHTVTLDTFIPETQSSHL